MGLISKVLHGPDATRNLGESIANVAEVFTPNETKAMELQAELRSAAMAAMAAEFAHARQGFFDRFVDGLNRLPRPFLAFGTLGLFIFAMVDPIEFASRMSGLNAVPEPLWWLLGAIVSFYFGARELHYFRRRAPRLPLFGRREVPAAREQNAAISAWRNEAL
ncbi:MAG: holin family protein [Pseudomonadota bacterium]